MAKKLGLALGAGGSRGVAHIGFLKALEEEGVAVSAITGASMGAVIGAAYASGMNADALYQKAKDLSFGDIFDLSLNPVFKGGLLRAKKMYKQVKAVLKDKTFNDLDTPFSCVAVDLCTGAVTTFNGEKEVAKCVCASSSIPGIFRPVEMDGTRFIDGGTKCRVPVQQAYDLGAEVVIGIDVLGKTRRVENKFNVFTVLFRAFEMMDAELTAFNVEKLKPEMFLEVDIGDMSQYKFKGIEDAYQAGYKLGKEKIEEIRKLIE